MTLKKNLFLLIVLAFAMNGFAQKTVSEKASNPPKSSTEKGLPQPKTTDKVKTISERSPAQRQDSLKNLSIKTELSPIDTLTNLSLKFKPYKKAVHASYYHNKFNGKRTSSGQRFSNDKYTAAHRKFPFGTILKITNEQNGKSVIVEVTDRGPFSRGREIDLTKKAFMEIADNKNSGSMTVTIEEQQQ